MRIFGIDPGSVRTGYGCVQSDGNRHRLVCYGSIAAPAGAAFPDRLRTIHSRLVSLIAEHRPDCVAIEDLFHARNVRSALQLGHARGVALLAAMESGVTVVEYTPTEIEQAVVGYGRAEKTQIQQMIKLLLGLDTAPSPHDAADALAVAVCHAHTSGSGMPPAPARRGSRAARSWRHVRIDAR